MRRIRGDREPVYRGVAQAQFPPQPLDTADPRWKTVLPQFGLEPFLAIRLTGTHMGGLDRHFQPRVLLGACRRSTGAPDIVTTSEHLQPSDHRVKASTFSSLVQNCAWRTSGL